MNRLRLGWTLIELLVVMAITLIISAILYPTYVSAKNSAYKAVCVENFREVTQGTLGYSNDYDDHLLVVSQNPYDAVGPSVTNPVVNHTWVQLLLPYTASFSVFLCPSDYTRGGTGLDNFDQDIVPGDLYARYHTASMHVNLGFNFMALSPIIRYGSIWICQPHSFGEVQYPSSTILFLDSAYKVSRNGTPSDGGSWLVAPPCRFERDGKHLIDLFSSGGESFNNVYSLGPWGQLNGRPYGGAFPWHFGRITMARTDGSVTTVTPAFLLQDCDSKTQTLNGLGASADYPWPLER